MVMALTYAWRVCTVLDRNIDNNYHLASVCCFYNFQALMVMEVSCQVVVCVAH